MIPKAFQDDRAAGLLDRVREDISHLRQDLGNLVTHTTRQTLPHGARELAGNARHQLELGRSYAVNRLRHFRHNGHPATRQTVGLLGGAVLVGALAAGAYLFFRGANGGSAGGVDGFSPGGDVPQ